MAELADAQASGACVLRDVEVRLLSAAVIGNAPVWCVYVLVCADKSFYVGMTKDLKRRLSEHRRCLVGWTKSRLPVELVHHERFSTRREGRSRERYLKSGWGKQWLKGKLGIEGH